MPMRRRRFDTAGGKQLPHVEEAPAVVGWKKGVLHRHQLIVSGGEPCIKPSASAVAGGSAFVANAALRRRAIRQACVKDVSLRGIPQN